MKIILDFKVHGFILAAAFFVGLSFGSSAAAQIPSYLVDLNSKTVTALGTLGGSTVNASGINDAGQWWVMLSRQKVIPTPSSPALMGRV